MTPPVRGPFPSLLASTSLAALLLPTIAAAQCATSAAPIGGRGADFNVLVSTMWDPDGAGPELPRLVVGGSFTSIGDVVANGIAAYEPVSRTWSRLGAGLTSSFGSTIVRALAVLPNGDLIVGGEFFGAGGVPVNNIARWNGTTWSALGAGLGAVRAMTVLPNGALVAAAVTECWSWNGTTWTQLGGTFGNYLWAVAAMPNGDVIAGGVFAMVAGVPAAGVARWNGTAWSALGSGVDGPVTSLLPLPNGDLLVGGGFLNAGGTPIGGIARWNGSTWSSLGSGFVNPVQGLALLPNGDIVAGGSFGAAGGVPAMNIARWDGTVWSALGNGLGTNIAAAVYTVAPLPGGDLFAGGFFGPTPGQPMNDIARWNGVAWSPPSAMTNGTVYALKPLTGGGAVAGGSFTTIVGASAAHVARYDGTAWTPLGAGFDNTVRAVLQLSNGDIVAGGDFMMAGTVPCSRIARWDGLAWHPLGAGLAGPVFALALSPGGEVAAGGMFPERIAMWNGTAWVATGVTPNSIITLTNAANGDLVAGGQFPGSPDTVWRWNGTTWTPLAGATQVPSALIGAPNGDIVFRQSVTTRRWNGATWATLPFIPAAPINANALAFLPDGDLVSGGVHRFHNGAWMSVAPATGPSLVPSTSIVAAMAFTADGELLVGGSFTAFGDGAASGLGRVTSSCSALSALIGSGCSGSGGANTLVATALPWLGGTCETTATGMPANGVVVRVFGFSAVSVPLSSVLPQALPGCTLLAAPDLLDVHVPVAGRCDTIFPVPAAASLVGQALWQQMVPVELGAGGAIAAVSSTNALQLTIGVF